ncbi:MAG TPA: hypothetical protein VMA83_07150 [Solirubrobacteraceae bacterium]|nr:hypothetical protein [Solirubrobacteraceae bacterium]
MTVTLVVALCGAAARADAAPLKLQPDAPESAARSLGRVSG